MSYPSYPEYRDSGLDWPSQIPSHWRTAKFKHLAQINNGRDYKEVEADGGPYPVIGSGGEFARANDYLYEGESVLLGRKGTVDKPLYVNGAFWTVDTMFYTHLEQHTSGRFLYYLATTISFDRYSTNTALPSMAQEDLANIQIVTPDYWEQTQIARFLDHQTARIDALIAEQQRLIELLKEKRQAVISHAVTKGLDPDVAMRNSGVEWLGNVPEHWTVAQLRYKGRLESGHTPSRSNPNFWVNCTIPWFTLSDVWQIRFEGKQYVYETSEMINEEGLKGSSARLLPAGSVILSRTASVGFPAILGREMAVSQDFAVWVCGRDVDSRFLWFVLLGMKNELNRLMMGSTHQTIYMPDLKYLKAAFPPKKEQEKIVEYLDSAAAKMEQLESEAHSGIELLQERRSALISAAVTGKIDVRDWEPPVSETFPQSTTSEEAPA